ncbi:hypothetical protein GUJ93_ZPchr0006g41486 [Zizania palustris]|uniref:Uncharacterized protein n=1 Tax=Zizania palustris TaxID=103762 RepID=A0A8J5T775_ZIZPA|nr:hypothetical protein GUJ93_ZPchr0006g41486 [Zizania palustris]
MGSPKIKGSVANPARWSIKAEARPASDCPKRLGEIIDREEGGFFAGNCPCVVRFCGCSTKCLTESAAWRWSCELAIRRVVRRRDHQADYVR